MPPEVSLEGVFLLAWRISSLYRHITRAVSGVSPWGKYPGFWRGLEEYPDTRERGVSSTLKGRERPGSGVVILLRACFVYLGRSGGKRISPEENPPGSGK